jgi:hypothetical protein
MIVGYYLQADIIMKAHARPLLASLTISQGDQELIASPMAAMAGNPCNDCHAI